MPRILVIDDDPQIRSMLKQFLELQGYEVEDADDGAAGLQCFREHPADVVITDVIMPGKEGIETIRDLRKEFPGVRIIAISGGGQLGPDTYLQMAKAFGAKRVFIKPFDMSEFLEGVKEVLSAP